MNRYKKPYHTGISTAYNRKNPKEYKRRKYLREPLQLDTSWIFVYDANHMYLGSIYHGLSNGSQYTFLRSMYVEVDDEKYKSPFKKYLQ